MNLQCKPEKYCNFEFQQGSHTLTDIYLNLIDLNFENHKQYVNHVHHSSRARRTGFCLQTSMTLTRNMNVKVAVEVYYIFLNISKFGYWYLFSDAEFIFVLARPQ